MVLTLEVAIEKKLDAFLS